LAKHTFATAIVGEECRLPPLPGTAFYRDINWRPRDEFKSRPRMRYLALLLAVILGACGVNQSEGSRIGDRTYRIISPEIAGGAEAPNRRLAQQLCPGGYRKLDEAAHKGGVDRADAQEQGITTIWTIKCL
jgi:hypothetical protein